MPACVGGWDTVKSLRREVRKDGLCDPQEMWAEGKEGYSWCLIVEPGIKTLVLEEQLAKDSISLSRN